MRTFGLIAAASTLIAGCGGDGDAPDPAPANAIGSPAAEARNASVPADAAAKTSSARWDLKSSGEGVALALLPPSGPAAIRLFCPAGGKKLLVNVPGFRPVGSEERLSFGSGGEAVALVADTAGDRKRGGVSASGDIPAGLASLVSGPLSASYGTQRSGPHPAAPRALASGFAAACRDGAAPDRAPAEPAPVAAGPCLTQDGKPLRAASLRAVGTEPFWSALVQGRCVTYSHPEDQKGARIWTRFTPGPGGGAWSGALGGRRFELRIRPERGCSDGMSDKSYPLVAELVVSGERLSGCAEPA